MSFFSSRDGGSGPHVLAVDDDPAALERTRKRLRAVGCRVSATASPNDIETYIALLQPDLLLLDVLMPGFRGEDVASILRRHPATGKTRVILLSPLSPALLANLVDTTQALGVLAATDDDEAFSRAFSALVDNSRSAESDDGERPDVMFSGTHRIKAVPGAKTPEKKWRIGGRR